MRSSAFESVAEAERLARRRLPRPIFESLRAGSERGATLDDNVAAFDELRFAPRLGGGSIQRDLTTTVMGRRLSMPVMISPTGAQAIHPGGEVAVARAAARAGTAIGLSSFASAPIEDVVAAGPDTFFQLYWIGGRPRVEQVVGRAREAGAKGLIVTVDWSFATRRDWGSPAIPERLTPAAALRFAPSAVMHPRWLWSYVKGGGLPDLTVPNLTQPGAPAPTFYGVFEDWMETPMPGWEDLAWLRELWSGPMMVKGLTRSEDARRAVDIGASAISVSTHGGNNLDGAPGAIRSLPGVAAAVGDQIEVVMDGGVRRGGDVVKARALGARAVMIGRPYLWALAVGGQAGVENVLEILRAGIVEALIGLGRPGIDELLTEDVPVPPNFAAGL